MYALIKNGLVEQYPYTLQDLRRANPNTSFPANGDKAYEGFGMYRVYTTTKPEDTATAVSVEDTPIFSQARGCWEQAWTTRNKTQEEIANDINVIKESIISATQERLDAFAQTRNYDGILSCCTYATSTNATFQAEGQRAVQLRDDTWQALYNILGQVATQGRVVASYADVEPDLPVLSWS